LNIVNIMNIMKIIAKLALVSLAGSTVGLAASCSLILGPFDPEPSQCWCGEQWRAQIAGARAYNDVGSSKPIPASSTTYTRCVSMLEHLALDAADPQDPVYMALRDAFESEAIANCELAGAVELPGGFDHTDCATTGADPVVTNLVYLGPCWVSEDLEAMPKQTCPLADQCGEFYDCSEDPISIFNGYLQQEGETDGAVPWTGAEELWSCDEAVGANVDGPGDVRF
jgi:hypothetical protein